MPRPGVGNPGNKGGGRKSAYEEAENAKHLNASWRNEQIMKELEAKINSGVYSLRDAFYYKAFKGNERFLSDIFKKIHPDLVDFKGDIREYIITRGQSGGESLDSAPTSGDDRE